MQSLTGVEIFQVGTWKGKPWTEADLDQMAENFQRLRQYVKPCLKLGHDDDQVLAQRDGQPALGWVERVYRQGKKLLADFANVPEVVVELIAARTYDRLSCEIWRAFETSDVAARLGTVVQGVQGMALHAVALLGADMPEVTTLADLHRLLATAEPGLALQQLTAVGSLADRADQFERITSGPGRRSRLARRRPAPVVDQLAFAPGSVMDFHDRVCAAVRGKFPDDGPDWHYYIVDLFSDRVVLEWPETKELVSYALAETATPPGYELVGDGAPVVVGYRTAGSVQDTLSRTRAENPREGEDMEKEAVQAMVDAAVAQATAVATGQITALTAQLTQLAPSADKLSAAEAELIRLRAEADGRKALDATLLRERRHARAEQCIETLSRKGNLRLIPAQRPWAIALLESLPDDGPELFAAPEAAELGLFTDAARTPKPLRARDLLLQLLAHYPDLTTRLTGELALCEPPAPDDFTTQVKALAATHQLDLSKPMDYARACSLFAQAHPDQAVGF